MLILFHAILAYRKYVVPELSTVAHVDLIPSHFRLQRVCLLN